MTRLKDLATVNRVALPEDTDPDVTFRYVDIGSVDGLGRISAADVVTFAGAPSRARRIVSPGDTIVSTVRTYLRAVAEVGEDAAETIVSTGFATLTAAKGVDARYLYWLMRSDPVIDDVVARSVGVSYPAINASQLGALAVPSPGLAEQRRIARFLDAETEKIDALIAEQERLVRLADERLRSRASSLLGQGRTPSGWPTTRLKMAVHSVTSGNRDHASFVFDGTGVPCVRGLNIKDGRIVDDANLYRIAQADHERHTASVLRAGDVVVVRSGAAGAAAVVPVELDGCNCVDLVIIRPGIDAHGAFIAYLINSDEIQSQVRARSGGAVLAHFNAEEAKELVVELPPPDEQAAIAKAIDAARAAWWELRSELTASMQLLQEHRRALITTAVTMGVDAARRKVA